MYHIKPLIDERKAKMREYKDSEWPDKPVSMTGDTLLTCH